MAEMEAAAEREVEAGRRAGIALLTASMRDYITEHGRDGSSLREWVLENEPSVQNGTRPLEMFMTEGTNGGYHTAWGDAMAHVRAQALLVERERQ